MQKIKILTFKISKRSIILFLLIFLTAGLSAQDRGTFSLSFYPHLNIPLGDSKDLFTLTGGGRINGDIFMPFAPVMHGRIALDYTMMPTQADTRLNMISFGAGIGANFFIIPRLKASLSAIGGYGLGMYEGTNGGGPFMSGEMELSFLVNPSFSIGAGVSYKHYFSGGEKLFNAVGVSLGVSYNFGVSERESKVEIREITINPMFPVFYKYYDENPLGEFVLKNNENGAIENVIVDFYISQYMERPKECLVIEEMEAGEEVTVPIYALFTDDVMEITEATKVMAEITVTYSYLNSTMAKDEAETVRMYDRNALTWDDDRKAASFVSSKSPDVLSFSKNIAGIVRGSGNNSINLNFRLAMGLFEALNLYGLNYIEDPKTPYAEFSEDEAALDFLQFPGQTLEYKAGDCDDLSILFCAMLESIGIETAFITIPGHIYMAFSLDMSKEEAVATFINSNDLIFIDNNTWVPVEITMINDGFLMAWQTGAREWRENEPSGKADFYSIHEAWELYEPVGIVSQGGNITVPDIITVNRTYIDTLEEFINREIQPRVNELTAAIAANNNHPVLINKLGVLYARYGMLDKAEAEFTKVLEQTDDINALGNMGNIKFLDEDFIVALDYYNKAFNIAPDNPKILAGLAKTYYEIQDYGSVTEYYNKLKIADSETAARFSYLVSETNKVGRASSQDIREVVIWNE